MNYAVIILQYHLKELSKDYQRILDCNKNSTLNKENDKAMKALTSRMLDVEKSINLLNELDI